MKKLKKNFKSVKNDLFWKFTETVCTKKITKIKKNEKKSKKSQKTSKKTIREIDYKLVLNGVKRASRFFTFFKIESNFRILVKNGQIRSNL